MINNVEHRLYVAATSQNDGKTSCSIGLLKGLGAFAKTTGFMKPVGQRYVVVGENQVDEDSVLIQRIICTQCALKDMNPIAVPKNFTREYLDNPEKMLPGLLRDIKTSYANIARDCDLVIIEGTGHAGVGSVFDLSNARVAQLLQAKTIIVTLGGIGQPFDEVALNRCLFERSGVEVIGVIANKVLPDKIEQTRDYLGKALKRIGLPLLGVIPYTPRLTWPTMQQVVDALKAKVIYGNANLHNIIAEFVVGAMTPHNALNFIRDKTLLIVPGDRDDLVLAVAGMNVLRDDINLAGILFTGGILPEPQTLDLLERTNIPVIAVEGATYETASRIQKLTVKIRIEDQEKIDIAAQLFSEHVDLKSIWDKL